ncbi:MAG TPA: hypothetical protein VKF36_05900 [Syntrophorhabdales bacterium]|nr:hypothetical protein [Syntrophorhabdales bacterium]
MARKKTKYKLSAFVAIIWEMLNSLAYRTLPPFAAKMLPYFLGKVKVPQKHPAYHTMEFTFPYSEAAALGCARRTFSRVLVALIDHGFVDPVVKGGLRGWGLSASKFRLSDRWMLYGNIAYHQVSWVGFGQQQIKKQILGGNRPRLVTKKATP